VKSFIKHQFLWKWNIFWEAKKTIWYQRDCESFYILSAGCLCEEDHWLDWSIKQFNEGSWIRFGKNEISFDNGKSNSEFISTNNDTL